MEASYWGQSSDKMVGMQVFWSGSRNYKGWRVQVVNLSIPYLAQLICAAIPQEIPDYECVPVPVEIIEKKIAKGPLAHRMVTLFHSPPEWVKTLVISVSLSACENRAHRHESAQKNEWVPVAEFPDFKAGEFYHIYLDNRGQCFKAYFEPQVKKKGDAASDFLNLLDALNRYYLEAFEKKGMCLEDQGVLDQNLLAKVLRRFTPRWLKHLSLDELHPLIEGGHRVLSSDLIDISRKNLAPVLCSLLKELHEQKLYAPIRGPIITALRKGDPEKAFAIAAGVLSEEEKHEAYISIAKRCFKHGELKNMKRALDKLPESVESKAGLVDLYLAELKKLSQEEMIHLFEAPLLDEQSYKKL